MNILAVSLAYPPLAYPRSIQVARLLKHADAHTALFCAEEPGARLDPTIEPDSEAKLAACIRVPVRRSGVDKLFDSVTHKFARNIWNRHNVVPDAYGKWRADVLSKIDSYLRTGKFSPDAIVTFAQPFSDHLIGLELKARLGLPWLAHFSDPWVDNPFTPMDAVSRKQNLTLEHRVAENADLLVFTSAETVDLFFAKYPSAFKRKGRILPQCYGENAESPVEFTGNGNVVIRYLGNFYGRRTPAPLISALKAINLSQPEALVSVRFELIGAGDADEATRLADGLPDGLLTVRSSVDYSKSIELMQTADGLLVIDAPAEKSVFLPSKLIDYIGAGRPVLAISPEGAAAGLVRALGGIVADPSNVDGIIHSIITFVALLRERRMLSGPPAWGDPVIRQQFTAANIASDFERMLDEIRS